MESVDCMGLACPQPVLRTKQFIESNPRIAEFLVVVDNEASAQNVARFIGTQGFSTSVGKNGKGLKVRAEKLQQACTITTEEEGRSVQKSLILVSSNKIGSGDDILGEKLMINYINTLDEMGESLWRLILVNSGVKLTIEGAETLKAIQGLEAQDVSVLVCGTCLNHFDLLEQKKVGETTNMLDIITSMQLADKVITI